MRKIKAYDLTVDVHAGRDDSELMAKYQLSARQLESALRKLLEADLITDMQFYSRTSLSEFQLTLALVNSGRSIGELD